MTSKAFGLAQLGNAYADGALSNRNLIINGAMQVAQRGTSFAISGGAAKYTVDRYYADISTSTSVAYTVAQSSDAPSGFTKSVGITVNTSGATGSNDYAYFRQIIEGYNFEHLNFGSSGASSFTLSFWVKSSVTGAFGLYFGADLNARFQVATYTISSANTWEYKTITIAGDTTGTWATGNSVGLQVAWSLSCGSTYLGATGSWGSSLLLGATGQTNITETSGATFQITGVQLEAGDTATPFEHRSYGQELALCQRYYQTNPRGTLMGITTGQAQFDHKAIVTFRATPSVALSTTSPYVESVPWNALGSLTDAITSNGHMGVNGGDVLLSGTYTPAIGNGNVWEVGEAVFLFSAEL